MMNENDESSGSSSGYALRSKTEKNPNVQHDPVNEMFFIKLGTSKAFISYTKCANVIQMDHTEVPEIYNGKGFGKLLAKVCVFVVCCMKRNEKYQNHQSSSFCCCFFHLFL